MSEFAPLPKPAVTASTSSVSVEDKQQPSSLEPYTRFNPVKQGFATVDNLTKPPVKLYYELYGTGKIKILFIMGLQSSGASWEDQVEHFGRLPNYQVCIYDNRGIGRSDAPSGVYSTRQMAIDALALIDELGWDASTSHIVGVSMGGMISQELALQVPKLGSLALVSTHAGRALTPFRSVLMFATAMFTQSLEKRVSIILKLLFPDDWLRKPVDGGDGTKTNFDVQKERYLRRMEVVPRASLGGALAQVAAVGRHYLSKDRLEAISKKDFRTLVLTGTNDALIPYGNSRHLSENISCPLEIFQDMGHALGAQCPGRFNATIRKFIEE